MTFAQPFSDYEILDRVGAGAMGTVFKARHKKLNRIVALKVLKPSLARDTRYVDRLRREARIVASLNHAHIVTGYDLGEQGGYHYFVMEFVEGKSLRALLVEWGMFAEEYVRRVARQVALALDHAYQRGVIHRDIKPGNILIDERGNVKLTDMGLAKGPADMTLTRDGATVGTPQYISPEQARNPQDVDVRSDLYSLGATLYHMATGVPPFRGDTMAQLLTKLLHETPVPPDEINPALSPGLSLVIRKLLAKDLRVRYQTPRELLDDLDRIERALPPQVDVDRLVASTGPRTALWPTLGVGLGVVALAGVALWIGTQMRGPDVELPTPDEFLVQLDRDLGAAATPGARLQILRNLSGSAPLGTEAQVLQRERAVAVVLQQLVDVTVAELAGPRWAELQAWCRDPSIWPDRQRCERERIAPVLRDRAGVVLGQLPPQVRTVRIDELATAIDRELAERDRELVVRFEGFLGSTLPARSEERVRAGDFAAASRLWADALATFCDGVRLPLPERIQPALKQRLTEMHSRAQSAAIDAIAAAEAAVASALRAEVDEVCAAQAERLRAGDDPDTIAAVIARFRQDLAQAWPAASRFRVGHDPWPGVEQQVGAMQQAVAAAAALAQEGRFDARCDLAWRAYCVGSADDALALLERAGAPAPRHDRQAARHREALEAARDVEIAVVQAISRAPSPVIAFSRTSAVTAVQLHTEVNGGALRLMCRAGAQPARLARLGEFRFGDLLLQLRQQGSDPMAALPERTRTAGVAVATMVADDLAGVGVLLRTLPAEDDAFLVHDVWPRIQRFRGEEPDASLDRPALFAGLTRAREGAARSGDLAEVEAALLACETRVPVAEWTDLERGEVRTTRRWLVLERRRRAVQAELVGGSPRGAAVSVGIANDEIAAEVAMPATVLRSGAGEGWSARGGALEFAGGDRPWSELSLQALRCNTGIQPSVQRSTLQVDFVVPPATIGRRFYVVEFRGIAVLLWIAANDCLFCTVVDGDLRREDLAQRAFLHVAQEAFGSTRNIVVPGAVHRLVIDVLPSATRRRAAVKVTLEGTNVFDESREVDPQAPIAVAFHARQEIAVHRFVVRAIGF
ncbi:MAG: serine/threonine protein kinase [Planctomycetes bacterium]|nr:serine/threonine protein kinase [Planctomycetota bacterium]